MLNLLVNPFLLNYYASVFIAFNLNSCLTDSKICLEAACIYIYGIKYATPMIDIFCTCESKSNT